MLWKGNKHRGKPKLAHGLPRCTCPSLWDCLQGDFNIALAAKTYLEGLLRALEPPQCRLRRQRGVLLPSDLLALGSDSQCHDLPLT